GYSALVLEHERRVPVALDGAGADHVARTGLDHGDRDGLAVVREHLGHTDLLAEQADLECHGEQLLRCRNEGGIYTRPAGMRQAAGKRNTRQVLRAVRSAKSSKLMPRQRATASAVWVRNAGSLRLPRRGTGARYGQ